jgi:hypothetical protein
LPNQKSVAVPGFLCKLSLSKESGEPIQTSKPKVQGEAERNSGRLYELNHTHHQSPIRKAELFPIFFACARTASTFLFSKRKWKSVQPKARALVKQSETQSVPNAIDRAHHNRSNPALLSLFVKRK